MPKWQRKHTIAGPKTTSPGVVGEEDVQLELKGFQAAEPFCGEIGRILWHTTVASRKSPVRMVAEHQRLGRRPNRPRVGQIGEIADQAAPARPEMAGDLPTRPGSIKPMPALPRADDVEGLVPEASSLAGCTDVMDLEAGSAREVNGLLQHLRRWIQTDDAAASRSEAACQGARTCAEIKDALTWSADPDSPNVVEEGVREARTVSGIIRRRSPKFDRRRCHRLRNDDGTPSDSQMKSVPPGASFSG